MQECGSDLSNHWHPCRLHAIQESLREVKHAQEVDSRQVDKNVLRCVPSDFLVLSKRLQYRFGKEQDNEERHEDHSVDDAGTIKVHSAEVELTSSIRLSNKSLQRSIHAHYDVKCQAFEYRCSKTESCQLMCIIEFSRINCINEVDQLHEDARDDRWPSDPKDLPCTLSYGKILNLRLYGLHIDLTMPSCVALHFSHLEMTFLLIWTIKRRQNWFPRCAHSDFILLQTFASELNQIKKQSLK